MLSVIGASERSSRWVRRKGDRKNRKKRHVYVTIGNGGVGGAPLRSSTKMVNLASRSAFFIDLDLVDPDHLY